MNEPRLLGLAVMANEVCVVLPSAATAARKPAVLVMVLAGFIKRLHTLLVALILRQLAARAAPRWWSARGGAGARRSRRGLAPYFIINMLMRTIIWRVPNARHKHLPDIAVGLAWHESRPGASRC